jgi:5-methylcytosine-specific restriction protein A
MGIVRKRGRALQAERADWFRLRPLCVKCAREGRMRKAKELDHIIPLFKGGKDVASNKQGLCIPCHAEKTALDQAHKPKVRYGTDGYPIE